jgi:hypothetical protein
MNVKMNESGVGHVALGLFASWMGAIIRRFEGTEIPSKRAPTRGPMVMP